MLQSSTMLHCGEKSGARVRYKLTFVTGLLECLCFAGIVFGWASLVFVLKTDGYFSELCVNVTEVNGTTDKDTFTLLDCSAQDEQFSLIFTVASFMNNFLTLPNGFLFDLYGTMATRFLAIFLYTTGTLLMAFSSKALPLLLFPALSFMAVAGIMFLLTNMQVGNLCGAHRSTIITLYNGAFDSSSVIFLIIKVLYEKGISLRNSFLFLAAYDIIHLLRTVFLFPKSHIPYPIPESYTYGLSFRKSRSYNVEEYESTPGKTQQDTCRECEPLTADASLPTVHKINEDSFKSCILSWFFVWHLIWLSVMQLRHYLFIGTLNSMLNRLANQDAATGKQLDSSTALVCNNSVIPKNCHILHSDWSGGIKRYN